MSRLLLQTRHEQLGVWGSEVSSKISCQLKLTRSRGAHLSKLSQPASSLLSCTCCGKCSGNYNPDRHPLYSCACSGRDVNKLCTCAGKIPNALADVDRKCLAAERPDHLTRSVPQSQLQKTAAVLFQVSIKKKGAFACPAKPYVAPCLSAAGTVTCLAKQAPGTMGGWSENDKSVLLSQDVALFHTRWAFNISDICQDIQRATHIWQVCAALFFPPSLHCGRYSSAY